MIIRAGSGLLVVMTRQDLRPALILDSQFHASAGFQLADGAAINLLPRCLAWRHGRDAFRLALGQLFVADQHVATAVVEIDTYLVAIAQVSQSAADSAFRRCVEDGRAVRGA